MNDGKKYWFPAKRFGWGWGLPNCWQGWAVLLAYIATMVINSVVFRPHQHPLAFLITVSFATVIFLAVCALKGEPPRWRWGGD